MGDNFQEQMLSFWESLDVIIGRTLNNAELHMEFYGEQCACTYVCITQWKYKSTNIDSIDLQPSRNKNYKRQMMLGQPL
jgi:hypothetical protein